MEQKLKQCLHHNHWPLYFGGQKGARFCIWPFFANISQRGIRAANIRTRKLENPGFRPLSCQLSCTATKLRKRDSRIVVLKKNLRRNRVNLYTFTEIGSSEIFHLASDKSKAAPQRSLYYIKIMIKACLTCFQVCLPARQPMLNQSEAKITDARI